MAKLTIVDKELHKGSKKPTRAKVLARLEEVAQHRGGGQQELDEAFAALTDLGPDASPTQVQAAQDRLRNLLAAGMKRSSAGTDLQ